MRAGDGSPDEMPHVARLGDRQHLDVATAEGLLAGRGVPGDSPPGQQALARMLEIAARPAGDEELAGVAAAVAGFVLVSSTASSAQTEARREARPRARRLTRLTLVCAAGAVALGGSAAFGGALPARLQEMVHVTFGAPAPGHEVSHPARGSQGRHPAKGPGYLQQGVPVDGPGHDQTTAAAASPTATPTTTPPATPTPTLKPPKPPPVPRPAQAHSVARAHDAGVPGHDYDKPPRPKPAAKGTG